MTLGSGAMCFFKKEKEEERNKKRRRLGDVFAALPSFRAFDVRQYTAGSSSLSFLRTP